VCLGRLIHADAGVRDRQAGVITGRHAMTPLDVLLVQRDARGPDAQPAAAGHGVAGVDGEVQKHLLELPGVGVDRACGGIERRGELDVLAEQAPQHPVHVRDHGIDVEHLGSEHLPAAERQQLPRELRGPKPRVPDFLGVLAPRSPGGVLCSSSWVEPRMAVSRLLKSWAMPPASCPTASIFCDWRSCSSSWRCALTSRASTSRARRPANSSGRATRSTSNRLPCLVQ